MGDRVLPAFKTVTKGDIVEVVYSERRWKLLEELRKVAIKIMEALEREGVESIVHGSVARGDVNTKSDVDVAIVHPFPPFKLEVALERAGFQVVQRTLSMATPSHAIKAHIHLDDKTTVTFPLVDLTRKEKEFYKFGGEIDLKGLKEGARVSGVDKRLMFIQPTPRGHVEKPLKGMEVEVVEKLRISLDTVLERSYILRRRDEVGRTGVYLKRVLASGEGFEEGLKRLADENPRVKKVLLTRGGF